MLINMVGFVLGLSVGSFINVLVFRKSIKTGLRGRSVCLYCKHKLSWVDLVPVISFFWLKGECRYCRKALSWQYPLVEILGGLGFLLILNLPFSNILMAWSLVLFSLALLISVYDFKYLIIPNKFLGLFFIWLAVGSFLFWRGEIVVHLLSGLVLASFFLALLVVSSGKWIGGGDISLSFLLGFWVGWPNILVLFMVTYLVGGFVAAMLLAYKKARLVSQVAFGPFLMIGAFSAFFWGEEIARWYLSFF